MDCTIPPPRTTSISRCGRKTASSTRRNGLVKPAEVQLSAPTTGCPQAQLGAGAARRFPRSAISTSVRAASASARGSGRYEPVPGTTRPACRANTRPCTPGAKPARVGTTRPGTRPSATHDTASMAIPARMPTGGSTAPSHSTRRGEPSSTNPTTFTKHNSASAAVMARPASATAPRGPGKGDVRERLQPQPLRRESVQRRQPGDGHRADEESAARPRHSPQQPAKLIELETAHRSLQRARAEKQQGLEDGVVGDVQQRSGKSDCGPRGVPRVGEQERRAETERDDADVLDRVIRQQALEVVLDERPQDPAQR